nr:hypothetical protein [Mucilaginibacter sp. L294]
MDFIANKLPDHTGSYIISAQIRQKDGVTLVFNYIAYYNAKTKIWHKYDPFTENEIGEAISYDLINAWKETGPVYLK